MTDAIRDEIDATFEKWSSDILTSKRSELAKLELIESAKDAITRLEFICKKIRELAPYLHGKEWFKHRELELIEDTLMRQGQGITHQLCILGLRDNVTDKMEYSYGVSFSGLKVNSLATSKEDGHTVFVLTPRNLRDVNVSFARDGKWAYLPINEFDSKYSE